MRGGGTETAPTPFDLFLASIGTCAGIYALGFMQQRGLDASGSKLIMRPHYNQSIGLIDNIELELHTPPGFPEKYRDAIVNAMDLCAVRAPGAASEVLGSTARHGPSGPLSSAHRGSGRRGGNHRRPPRPCGLTAAAPPYC